MAREFKDSGIEWIGQIPKEWGVARFKFVSEMYTGNSLNEQQKELYSDSEVDETLPYIATKDVERDVERIDYEGGIRIPLSTDKFSIAPKNSVLLCIEGGSAGKKVGYTNQDVYFVNKLCCVRTDKNSRYFYYFILSHSFSEPFLKNIQGLIGGVSISVLKNFVISIPPLFEQQKIADYLDKVCGEVDEMVVLQEKMIEELKAYKQSVITEAVTKGQNPNAPMRNSGIDWIGEIPEHWGIQRLKTLGWTQNGISQSGDYFGEDYEYPFISYSDVYKNYSLPYPSGKANSSEEDRQRYSIIEGDVLFTRTSETIEEIGFASTCIETIPNVVYSGFLIRFRPTSEKLFKGFSKYYFRSQVHRAYFVKQMNIVTRASLGQDLLKNLVVLLPPLDEQRNIASYLDTKCSEIDSLIALKQAKIEELKEYKKSVIYEYVTGKKEVV